MLIHEVSQITHLTKKAITYYVEQGLIRPVTLENGYRDFQEAEIQDLKKIAVLRRLGLSLEEIRTVLPQSASLQELTVQKELLLQKAQQQKDLLEQLLHGASYEEIARKLDSLERTSYIKDRLLDAFPGYYGRYATLHFAGFLQEPVTTPEQEQAYQEILDFLDNMPPLPREALDFLDDSTGQLTAEQIASFSQKIRESVADPDTFLDENKEALDSYAAYLQSEEYKASPAFRMKEALLEFNRVSGYNTVFLPAMKRLSPSYARYCQEAELANEKLLAKYPQADG